MGLYYYSSQHSILDERLSLNRGFSRVVLQYDLKAILSILALFA